MYVNVFGSVYVVADCSDAVSVSYSVTGCINGNAVISINDADVANDDVPANWDALDAVYELKDDVDTNEPVSIVTPPIKNDAVAANDAVPCNDPVIPAVTSSDPVMFDDPSEKNPFFMRNSFIAFPYPS